MPSARLLPRCCALQADWLQTVSDMVTLINECFSVNFKEIGCAGEIRLQEDEDFDKYAIEIL